MDRFLFSVYRISMWMGRAFGWCIMIGAIGSTYEVIATKLFRAPTVWAFDLSYMMYGCLFMMAGAYALSRDSHVRGDVIYRLLGPRYQASIEMFLYIIFFFPGVIALVYAGSRYAWQSYTFSEKSVMSVAWFPVFQFKFIIPLAGLLLFLQGIAQVLRCWLCLRDGVWPTHLQDVEELEKVALAQHDNDATGATEKPS